jgi:recombination protein RecR
MDPVSKLIELFSEFPGIGPRQARRFAYFILTRNNGFLDDFIRNITAAKKSLRVCPSCQRFFTSTNTSSNASKICSICSDEGRDHASLMIVARDSDLEAIEKSGVYNGLYFVLGGIVPILEKEPEKRVRLAELKKRVQKMQEEMEKGRKEEKNATSFEIILSMSVTPDGEHTAEVVKVFLEKNIDTSKLKITVLGKGLSTGTELEYSDTETLKNALKNRY